MEKKGKETHMFVTTGLKLNFVLLLYLWNEVIISVVFCIKIDVI